MLAATVLAFLAATVPAVASARVRVLATGLEQPKKLTFTSSGELLVALSGDGVAPASCTDGAQASCADDSGAIDEISPAGEVTRLLGGLSSVSSGGQDAQATGPVEALAMDGKLEVLFQGSVIRARTGREVYGAAGSELQKLLAFPASAGTGVEADFGRYDARHDPQREDPGTEIRYGQSEIDSDPYSFVPYRGGFAVADAGANDVLFVSRAGRVSLLAVLPTIREWARAGSFGASQRHGMWARAQAVPTAVAVGPDGALYVGELGGEPYDRGTSDIYRILPGRRPSVYASGLTGIADMTFDPRGRLLVLEIDRKGLDDPGFADGHPASGAILAVWPGGRKRTLLAEGLTYPTGIAVARDGTVYLAEEGVSSEGEILAVSLGSEGRR